MARVGPRLLQALLVVFGVSAISFALLYLSGDPSVAIAGDNFTRAQIDEFRRLMRFDRPWYEQYFDFIGNALRGDFGTSLRQHRPAFEILLERLPATLQLSGTALVLSVAIGLPVGVLSASRRGSFVDRVVMLAALAGQSMPVFWVGAMLILVFGVWLQWLPVAGRGDLTNLILPATALALFSVGRNARLTRAALLDALGTDYVRTARAKGLTERRVLWRHAFRSVLLPVVTVIGLDIGHLIGGAVITETIFAWPGVGRLTVEAVLGKDLPLVQAAVLVLATGFVLINLAVDLLYTYLDPRLRRG